MPPQLDRITHDSQFGIAFIRDTDITVSEIVSQIMSGRPTPDILEEHSELEQEDIQQALIFALQDLKNLIAMWANEGKTPLTSIRGFSDLLANQGEHFSEEDWKEFIGHIYRDSYTAIDAWNHLSLANNAKYGNKDFWTLGSISEVIQLAIKPINNNWPESVIEVQVLQVALLVKHNYQLPYAIENLLSNDWMFQTGGTIKVEQTSKKNIVVRINRKIKNDNISTYELSHLAYSNSPIQTAAIIIHQHGGELKAVPSETGVTFEFTLPIYNENPSHK
jgi:uncharacterized protein (DUF433 family)